MFSGSPYLLSLSASELRGIRTRVTANAFDVVERAGLWAFVTLLIARAEVRETHREVRNAIGWARFSIGR